MSEKILKAMFEANEQFLKDDFEAFMVENNPHIYIDYGVESISIMFECYRAGRYHKKDNGA
jgi:hypothetical protein